MKREKVEKLFLKLWDLYGALTKDEVDNMIYKNNSQMIHEFFFIILGGYGISYELNKSACEVLNKKGYFESSLYKNRKEKNIIRNKLVKEFDTRQFIPKTKNNNYRKYRFKNKKANIVANAGNWLWEECKWDINEKIKYLDKHSREWLLKCPGFGLKSASWFLRNIGFSWDFAVLDVHVLRFLSNIGFDIPKNINEKNYLRIESVLQNICKNIGVELGYMDYLLWTLGRNGYLDYVG